MKRKRKHKIVPAKFQQNFLGQLDGRYELTRELRASFEALTADLGGLDSLSHIKRTLCERFIWLSAILRGLEKKISEGDATQSAELLGRWIQGLNSLTGLAKTLGVERLARKADLQRYIEGVDRK
jgi:hypothetical protein